MSLRYEKAKTLPEAIALNAAFPDYPVLAGGTDLVVRMNAGDLRPQGIVDISRVPELRFIHDGKDSFEIGPLVCHADLAQSRFVQQNCRPLSEACAQVGSVQIQNVGTIGGNVMNASPAADTVPVLAAFEAIFKLQAVNGERFLPADQFFTGYKKTAILPTELLTSIAVPKRNAKGEVSAFYKVGTRRAQSISKVVMCVRARIDHGAIENISIAAGSVAPTVVRARATEAFLTGKAISRSLIDKARLSIMDEFHPIDDIRSTAEYRKIVCSNLLMKFLEQSVTK